MATKQFPSLLIVAAAVAVVVSILAIAKTTPLFAAPSGIATLKLFNELEATQVESTVNDWLSAQSGIVIDSIDVDTSGSYQIAIGYHSGPPGALGTRIKLFQLESDAGTLAAAEAEVNTFLSSLSSSRNVRALDVVVGTGAFPATFLLYD
jgi:hypothetical protein